ncbi:MAG: hypothetical protein NZ772_18935 [Cyanobacteria bacterium]|nr:hypothetical protein [Cyanobacteriota bacterium]MDW8201489.1 hypothetical protein [Cyanobacteriota bacterium SKYGB_h_bin112]
MSCLSNGLKSLAADTPLASATQLTLSTAVQWNDGLCQKPEATTTLSNSDTINSIADSRRDRFANRPFTDNPYPKNDRLRNLPQHQP